MGGHTGVPQFEGEEGTRFFTRHPSEVDSTAGPVVGMEVVLGGQDLEASGCAAG